MAGDDRRTESVPLPPVALPDGAAGPGSEPRVSLERIELLSALDREGCPMCWISQFAATRYLRSLLHEYVLDVGIRARLHRSGGFCQEHAWELQRLEVDVYHDNMGTATLYEDLAAAIARTIRASAQAPAASNGWLRLGGRDGSPLLRALDLRGTCPACDAAAFKVGYLTEFLMRNLRTDEEIRAKLQQGFGLCLPHFRRAVQIAAPEGAREFLVEVEAGKFEVLAAQLGEYLLKHTWGHHDEPKGSEQTSPVRVVEQFVGKRR
jgi:hypothetical protein